MGLPICPPEPDNSGTSSIQFPTDDPYWTGLFYYTVGLGLLIVTTDKKHFWFNWNSHAGWQYGRRAPTPLPRQLVIGEMHVCKSKVIRQFGDAPTFQECLNRMASRQDISDFLGDFWKQVAMDEMRYH